jgi:transcriptional regulator with XRE-family HTH domain
VEVPSLGPVRVPYLRTWRLYRGMSQVDLRRRAHVSRSAIALAETGNPVWRTTAAKLAKALRIDPAELSQEPPKTETEDGGRGLVDGHRSRR